MAGKGMPLAEIYLPVKFILPEGGCLRQKWREAISQGKHFTG